MIAQMDDTMMKTSETVPIHQKEKTAIGTQKTMERNIQDHAQYSE